MSHLLSVLAAPGQLSSKGASCLYRVENGHRSPTTNPPLLDPEPPKTRPRLSPALGTDGREPFRSPLPVLTLRRVLALSFPHALATMSTRCRTPGSRPQSARLAFRVCKRTAGLRVVVSVSWKVGRKARSAAHATWKPVPVTLETVTFPMGAGTGKWG